jgi:hypothetical protein
MSDREHMGTEQNEADRQWNGRRETLYDHPPEWNAKLAGILLACILSFAAGVALEDQMTQSQKITEKADEAVRFAAKVRACESDPKAGTAVARQNGTIECHSLMPRFAMPLEGQRYNPTRRELRRILRTAMKGEQQ